MSAPTPPTLSTLHDWIRTLLIPVVLVVVGGMFTCAGNERAAEARMVELATQVLQAPPTDSTRPLRAWAVEVIDRYSAVKLSPQLKALLSDSLQLSRGTRLPEGMIIVQGEPTEFDSAGRFIYRSKRVSPRDTVLRR